MDMMKQGITGYYVNGLCKYVSELEVSDGKKGRGKEEAGLG